MTDLRIKALEKTLSEARVHIIELNRMKGVPASELVDHVAYIDTVLPPLPCDPFTATDISPVYRRDFDTRKRSLMDALLENAAPDRLEAP